MSSSKAHLLEYPWSEWFGERLGGLCIVFMGWVLRRRFGDGEHKDEEYAVDEQCKEIA